LIVSKTPFLFSVAYATKVGYFSVNFECSMIDIIHKRDCFTENGAVLHCRQQVKESSLDMSKMKYEILLGNAHVNNQPYWIME
jgi:hypothetical protein